MFSFLEGTSVGKIKPAAVAAATYVCGTAGLAVHTSVVLVT